MRHLAAYFEDLAMEESFDASARSLQVQQTATESTGPREHTESEYLERGAGHRCSFCGAVAVSGEGLQGANRLHVDRQETDLVPPLYSSANDVLAEIKWECATGHQTLKSENDSWTDLSSIERSFQAIAAVAHDTDAAQEMSICSTESINQ